MKRYGCCHKMLHETLCCNKWCTYNVSYDEEIYLKIKNSAAMYVLSSQFSKARTKWNTVYLCTIALVPAMIHIYVWTKIINNKSEFNNEITTWRLIAEEPVDRKDHYNWFSIFYTRTRPPNTPHLQTKPKLHEMVTTT